MPAPLDSWEDSAQDEQIVAPLSRQQADALQAKLGSLCLICGLLWQGSLMAALLVLLAFLGLGSAVWISALVGVLAAWLPQCLWVLGAGRKLGQLPAAAWLLRLFVWEAAKWLFTLVLMALAVYWIRDISWVALLLAFIVTLKVGWGVLFVQHLRKVRSQSKYQGDLNE